MNKPTLRAALLFVSLAFASAASAAEGERKLRIICFGAHPDDCEIQAGGVGALWAARGHAVKFVSVTNGDIGHWKEAGGPLARRRLKEVQEAAKILGVTTEVLDNHDGELMPTLENRLKIIRLIREWKADVVMSPRPWDYHPDHRNTALLVQDAAYMVTVPFIAPDVPHLKENPVFFYYTDRFQKPYPSQGDVVVSIDAVVEKKLDALGVMESQFLEGGANGHEGLMPRSPEAHKQRATQVRQNFSARFRNTAERYRKEAADFYPDGAAEKIKFAEAFEVCEYGRRPTKEELRRMFPVGEAAAR